MSILYISITEFAKNGFGLNSRTIEEFKDENEMVRWFAYDYRRKEGGRYSSMVEDQRLCREDMRVGGYKYQNEELVPSCYVFRKSVLYDNTNNRIIDIRNYKEEIENHIGDSLYKTEIDKIRYQKEYLTWRYNHGRRRGRTHHKSGHFKHIALGKCKIKLGDSKYERYERSELEEYETLTVGMCKVPCIRRKALLTSLGWWDDYYANSENNWKEKKIKHQWQYHQKGNFKTDVEEYRNSKACKEYTRADTA